MLNKSKLSEYFDFGLFVSFLIILNNVPLTIEHDYMDIHRDKPMSLESCLGRFDVHTNTIIRTGESQAIGGKFLQGLELETPEKCQRLCCETQDCDVYVFEEKNDGYCYLFECGSPKNFHCKFTRHPNYTSALITEYKSVLPTTPRPIPHVFLSNISTQEQELISLKLKPEKVFTASTAPPPVEVVTTESRLMPAVATESRNLTCGRFEFPCHSGECIAVYNACNGIPQCVDGSDEGPECATANNPVKPIITHHSETLKPEILPQVPVYRHNLKFAQVPANPPVADDRGASASSPTVWVNQKVQADTQADMDRTTFGRKTDLGVPIKNIMMNMDEVNEKEFPNQREMYAQLPPIRSSFPTPQIVQPTAHVYASNIRWPSQRQQWQAVNPGPMYPVQEQAPPNLQPQQHLVQPSDDQMMNVGPKVVYEQQPVPQQKPPSSVNYPEKSGDLADYPEKTFDVPKKPQVETTKTEEHKPVAAAKSTPHPSVVEQYKMIEQHLELQFSDHDGFSERPRGAVLSLTLGLMVAGIIVVLIGCRLRTAGRRGGRHGGKVAYEPDEDFLVNGMYL